VPRCLATNCSVPTSTRDEELVGRVIQRHPSPVFGETLTVLMIFRWRDRSHDQIMPARRVDERVFTIR
jgi:hypothetical protein